MTTVTLNQSVAIQLNASGNGTAKVGPLTNREVWSPQNAHVSANTNPVNQAQCSVYVGDAPTSQNFRDATVSGSSGDSTSRINADTVHCGQYVYAVWTGGDANVFATLTVTGQKDV
jgi:hypothetical protein